MSNRETEETALFQEEAVDVSRMHGIQMLLVGLGTAIVQHLGYTEIAATSAGVVLIIAGLGYLLPTSTQVIRWRSVYDE